MGLAIGLDTHYHTKQGPPASMGDHLAAATMQGQTAQDEAIAKAERSEVDRQYARSPRGINAQRP
jgi:hypothetical protein